MKRRKARPSEGFRCFQRGDCEPTPEVREEIRLRILSIQEFKEARQKDAEYNTMPVAVVSYGAVRRHGVGVSHGESS